VYAVVGWSLIINILGSTVSGAAWLDHISLFHYMALAPAEDPAPITLAVTAALAIGLCAIATGVFARRDIQPS
jgi:putative exporter of polyketide antibiotics